MNGGRRSRRGSGVSDGDKTLMISVYIVKKGSILPLTSPVHQPSRTAISTSTWPPALKLHSSRDAAMDRCNASVAFFACGRSKRGGSSGEVTMATHFE